MAQKWSDDMQNMELMEADSLEFQIVLLDIAQLMVKNKVLYIEGCMDNGYKLCVEMKRIEDKKGE